MQAITRNYSRQLFWVAIPYVWQRVAIDEAPKTIIFLGFLRPQDGYFWTTNLA